MKVRRRIVLTVLTLGVLCCGTAAARSLLTLSLDQASTGDGLGTWYTLAPMPTARQEISSAYYAGYVVTIGGYNAAGASTNTVEAYDP